MRPRYLLSESCQHLLQRYLLVTGAPDFVCLSCSQVLKKQNSPHLLLKIQYCGKPLWAWEVTCLTADSHVSNFESYSISEGQRPLIYLCFPKIISCTIWDYVHKNGQKPHSFKQRSVISFIHVFPRTQWFTREDAELLCQYLDFTSISH